MEELRRNKNTISFEETVFEGTAEQGVELDYVLPDYCPEIFKILKCRLIPKILSYSIVGGNKLLLDGSVDIKVLYLGEGSNAIYCIDQHYTYSKSIDIGKNVGDDENNTVKLAVRPDYCNCRAVSGRRIDVRGAVSTRIQIRSDKEYEIPDLPDAIQVNTMEITCCDKMLNAEKQFSIREDIETGSAGISFIVRDSVIPKINEIRLIADKAVVKGVITVNASYGLTDKDNAGCTEFETMTADIPVSQIIDIDGINDNFSCCADIDVLNYELSCNTDSGIVSCNIQAVCRVSCRKSSSVSVPCDAFSTEYECELSTKTLKAVNCCDSIEKQHTIRSSIGNDECNIETVWDCNCDIYNVVCSNKTESSFTLSGQINYQIIGKSSEGIPCCIEKQDSFDCEIPVTELTENSNISFSVVCSDTDYSIKSDASLEFNAKIMVKATICNNICVDTIDNVTICEDRPISHDDRYAIRIYYADGTEKCWDIAKRYGASVDAIVTENDIEDKNVTLNGMVLIPVI